MNAGVETIFGKRIAHNPGELAKLMRVCKTFYFLIRNSPEVVGYYLEAINTINHLTTLERSPSQSVFGGRFRQLMSPKEMKGLVISADSIEKIFPSASCAYISLGNSPVALLTFMKSRGATVLPLPLSGVSHEGIEMWRNDVMRARMMEYLNHFVSPALLKNKQPVVVDVSASGESLRVTRFMLSEYYKACNYPTNVTMLALNNNDLEKPALSPEIGREQIKGLPGGNQLQYDFLAQILGKFYKEGIKYLLWNRTEMIDIFRGDRINPEVQEAFYQRMLIEILRIQEVLEDLRKNA